VQKYRRKYWALVFELLVILYDVETTGSSIGDFKR
jgi:hypothetical protein